jgi:proline iminopeptidase
MAEQQLVELPDETHLWATVEGSGPAVILCHGGPGLWDYLGPLAALLAGDFTVVRYHQRGCGRSDPYDGPFTIQQAVEDLDQVRRAHGFDEVGLLGHSWGAELVLRYAAVHPGHTRSVAYVSGVGGDNAFRPAFAEEFERRLGDSLERWRRLSHMQDRPVELEHEYCLLQWAPDFSPSSDPSARAEAQWRTRPPGAVINVRANRQLWADRATDDLVSLADRVTAPVLMLFGADDPRPWRSADPVHRALSDVGHLVLAGAGHAPWAERPQAAIEALVAAL